MGKSILVMDMPEICNECPLCTFGNYGLKRCQANGEILIPSNISGTKPDWCPLQDVPEKKGGIRGHLPEYDTDNHYEIGWNACIDQILNGG